MTKSLGYLSSILVIYSILYLILRIFDLSHMEERYERLQKQSKEMKPDTHDKFHDLYKEVNYYTFFLAVGMTCGTCYLKYSLY